MSKIRYKPDGETLKRFLLSKAFFRGIRGPVGSGKSVACCFDLFKHASEQQPHPDTGIRYSRFAVIRNTNPQLKSTTIKTWLHWFPEESFGRFNWGSPYTHHIKVGDIDMEVIFLSMDKQMDVRKMLSLDVTGSWINEAREIRKDHFDIITSRAGRYPEVTKKGKRQSYGPSWYGTIADTNSPDDDHWWPIMAGDAPLPEFISEEESLMLVKPDNFEFFTQPPGMLEQIDPITRKVSGYVDNPKAENYAHLVDGYYENQIRGKTKSWINVYVLNRLDSIIDGKAVQESFSKPWHVSKDFLEPNPSLPLLIGIDFGRTPALIICQRDRHLRVLKEIQAYSMGSRRFAAICKKVISQLYPGYRLQSWGDPRGVDPTQVDDSTPFLMFRNQGFNVIPAPTNDFMVRTETLDEMLGRAVEGEPYVQIDPRCKILIRGLDGAYCYKRVQSVREEIYEETPDKNRFSHICEALQYLALGIGEARSVLTNPAGHKLDTGQAKADRSVWDRMERRRKKRHNPFHRNRRSERP